MDNLGDLWFEHFVLKYSSLEFQKTLFNPLSMNYGHNKSNAAHPRSLIQLKEFHLLHYNEKYLKNDDIY